MARVAVDLMLFSGPVICCTALSLTSSLNRFSLVPECLLVIGVLQEKAGPGDLLGPATSRVEGAEATDGAVDHVGRVDVVLGFRLGAGARVAEDAGDGELPRRLLVVARQSQLVARLEAVLLGEALLDQDPLLVLVGGSQVLSGEKLELAAAEVGEQ
jgi:hypothetical protein